MTIQSNRNRCLRFLLLIYILCYAAIIHGILLDANDAEICNLLCEQCNASAVFSDDYCECNFTDDNDKDTKCIQHLQREIQTINLNVLSDEDLTDEERNVRSILKSRRRLKMGDADKVAQYFINGGPSAGHFHLVRAYNAAYDNTDSMTNSFSGVADKNNPENEFNGVSSRVSLTSPVSWSTNNCPLYVVPEAARQEDPVMLDTRERPSILGSMNSALSYPTNGWYDLINPLLGSIVHPYGTYGHGGLPLHHTLLRTATLPTQILHNLFAHRLSNRYYPAYHPHRGIVRNANPLQDNLSNVPFVTYDRSCKNADDVATSYDSSTARNNVDNSVAYNIAANVPGSDFPIQSTQFIKTPYIFGADTLHQPTQHRYFGSPNPQYAYFNPLINMLHPLDGYILQPVSHLQSTPNQLISAPSPTTYYTSNANSEQQSDVSFTTDKTVNIDDKKKGLNNVITNVISKEEKKAENNGGNKA